MWSVKCRVWSGERHHFAQPWQCDLQKKTQDDTFKVLCLPRKMTSDVSKVLRVPRKMQRIFWKRRKSIAPATQNDFWHVMKNTLKCHKVPRLPCKTTLQPVLKPSPERFCSSPHRHGDATGKPETHEVTCWSTKTSMSWFLTFHTSQRQNRRFEFSYEPTSKPTFRARLPPIFTTCHKMPRLPRNLHLVPRPRSADNAIRKNHTTRHV